MFYFLHYLSDHSIVFNLFRYITFRSAGASVTAFFLSLWLGPRCIAWLKQLRAVTNQERAYAETIHGGKKTAEEALKRAETIWNGNEKLTGEGDDPYFHLCFGADPPLGEDFRQMAVAVFEPLLNCREKRGK